MINTKDFRTSETSAAFKPLHASSLMTGGPDKRQYGAIPTTSSYVQQVQQRDSEDLRNNVASLQEQSIFTLSTEESSSVSSWEQHYHSPHNPLSGILYAESYYRSIPVDEINRRYGQQRKWTTHPLTKDKFGNFKVPDTRCVKCLENMSVKILFHFGGDSRMRDTNKNAEIVCPLIQGTVMNLAHLSCLRTIRGRNSVFKVLGRKISFREWWTQTNPWKDILKALMRVIVMLVFSAYCFYIGFVKSRHKKENTELDVEISEAMSHHIIFVLFLSIVGGAAVLMTFAAFVINMEFVKRVIRDFVTACRGNCQEMLLELWEPLNKTVHNYW